MITAITLFLAVLVVGGASVHTYLVDKGRRGHRGELDTEQAARRAEVAELVGKIQQLDSELRSVTSHRDQLALSSERWRERAESAERGLVYHDERLKKHG